MRLITESITEIDGEYWFMERRFNAVFILNPESGKITYRCSLPEGSAGSERLAVKLLYTNGKIYFVPMCAEKLWEYSIKDGTWIGYDVFSDLGGKVKKRAGKFLNAFINDQTMYLMGSECPYWVAFDLNSKQIRRIPFEDEKGMKEGNTKDAFFRSDYVLVEGKVYRASCRSNKILVFDIDKETFSYTLVGSDNNAYSGLAFDGKAFWLAPRRNTPVVRWTTDGKWQEYDFCRDLSEEKCSFLGAFYNDGKVSLPAMDGDLTLEISVESKEIIGSAKKNFFLFNKLASGKFVSLDKSCQLVVRSSDESVRKYQLAISPNEIPVWPVAQKEMREKTLYEGDRLDVKEWLELCV